MAPRTRPSEEGKIWSLDSNASSDASNSVKVDINTLGRYGSLSDSSSGQLRLSSSVLELTAVEISRGKGFTFSSTTTVISAAVKANSPKIAISEVDTIFTGH